MTALSPVTVKDDFFKTLECDEYYEIQPGTYQITGSGKIQLSTAYKEAREAAADPDSASTHLLIKLFNAHLHDVKKTLHHAFTPAITHYTISANSTSFTFTCNCPMTFRVREEDLMISVDNIFKKILQTGEPQPLWAGENQIVYFTDLKNSKEFSQLHAKGYEDDNERIKELYERLFQSKAPKGYAVEVAWSGTIHGKFIDPASQPSELSAYERMIGKQIPQGFSMRATEGFTISLRKTEEQKKEKADV